MLGRSLYLYYATTCADDVLGSEDIPMADDDNLPPPTSLTEIIQQSNYKAKPALRRRSPPIASEDELTDSVSFLNLCFKGRDNFLAESKNYSPRKSFSVKKNFVVSSFLFC
jgi:hypothetical protein